ncbi:MAG: glycoside hydrolase family 3 N-terminal domain-containing protein, partial [Propionibacteriaceae bacterium]
AAPDRARRSRDERPWMDAGLDLESRVGLLLAELTLVEKAGQLHLGHNLDPVGHADQIASGQVGAGIYSRGANSPVPPNEPPIPEGVLGCQQVAAERSRLGIPILFGSDIVHGHRTTFPIPLALASTWDLGLVEACAEQSASEARADGLAWTFAPMVDISTEPRWGRIGETFGDEPTLSGRMAAAMIRGLQSADTDSAAGARLSACAKHFCGYGLVQAERDHETLSVGPNTLHNVHLRPFRAAVEAGCRSIMVGFHDVDGVPMHCNTELIRDLLKEQWGFDGVVVSDWDGIGQLVHQGVAVDLADAVRQAIVAGVDMDMMSGGYRRYLPELVTAGVVDAGLVDDAVARVLRLKFSVGLFDQPRPALPRRARSSATAAGGPVPDRRPVAAELARTVARSSMVLLKNSGILPLHGNLGTVHLCGPFVDEGDALLGTWVLAGLGTTGLSPAKALAEQIGVDNLVVSDGRFADLAVRLAGAADVTVALVGEHPSRSGEDRCLASAELPAGQLEVLKSLAALGKPLVVVVLAGRPLELRPVMMLADAVLIGWYPGAEGGQALAEVLIGRAEPTGRLPMNLPRMSQSGESGTLERTTGRRVGRSSDTKFGRYLNALVHPELTLGYGLTYTSFGYSALELNRTQLPLRSGVLRASVDVTNTGRRPGREVVQLYLRDLVADVTRPLLELADWQIIDLDPGCSTRVTFKITAETFGYWGRDLSWRVDPGEVDVIIGPNAAHGSSARVLLTA